MILELDIYIYIIVRGKNNFRSPYSFLSGLIWNNPYRIVNQKDITKVLPTGTLNLKMCADSSTNTKKIQKEFKTILFLFICVMCRLSPVICHLSPVTCQLSTRQTATVTDPPPANSPTMYSRLVCQKSKHFK